MTGIRDDVYGGDVENQLTHVLRRVPPLLPREVRPACDELSQRPRSSWLGIKFRIARMAEPNACVIGAVIRVGSTMNVVALVDDCCELLEIWCCFSFKIW